MKIKVCPYCKIKKPIREFNKRAAAKDGLQFCCKKCAQIRDKKYYKQNKHKIIKQNQEWYIAHKDRKRNYDLKMKYGITLSDYNRMFEKQKGNCAICGKHQSGFEKTILCVDHSHVSGIVRGLVCRLCNAKLGWLEKRWGLIHTYLGESK